MTSKKVAKHGTAGRDGGAVPGAVSASGTAPPSRPAVPCLAAFFGSCDVLRPPPVHPHMLRHACGFKLANDGKDTRALQEWLGHSNIQHTTRYTELTPERFKSFFADEE